MTDDKCPNTETWERRFVELHRLMACSEFIAPRIHLVAMRCAKAETLLESLGWFQNDLTGEWERDDEEEHND